MLSVIEDDRISPSDRSWIPPPILLKIASIMPSLVRPELSTILE